MYAHLVRVAKIFLVYVFVRCYWCVYADLFYVCKILLVYVC
jgi:hypothetical protein